MTTIADIAAALPAFRGCYAEEFRTKLAGGRQPNWSGSHLKGKASKYGGSYHRTRLAVIEALKAEGLRRGVLVERVALTRYGHGRIVVDVVEGPIELCDLQD